MFDFLFSTKGRISRKGYFIAYFLPYFALTQLLPKFLPSLGIVWALVGLFFLFPSLVAVPVRRFHDMGATGWYHAGALLLILIAAGIGGHGITMQMDATGVSLESLQTMSPAEQESAIYEMVKQSGRAQLGFALMALVSLAEFVLFLAVAGTSGSNKYGNDPLADGRGFAD